jgi:hypothetical protein
MPNTICEELKLPAKKDMVSIMIGEKESRKLDEMPLSGNIVSRIIYEMALHV